MCELIKWTFILSVTVTVLTVHKVSYNAVGIRNVMRFNNVQLAEKMNNRLEGKYTHVHLFSEVCCADSSDVCRWKDM